VGPLGGRVVACALAAVLLSPVAAAADGADGAEEPDTTPPAVALDPCPGTPAHEPCSQRLYAYVVGHPGEADDLSVLVSSLDGQVVEKRVHDDGTGFVPYGYFVAPFGDVVEEVDFAAVVEVPPGLHEVAFTARDLAGNEVTTTRSVVGAEAPGPVTDLQVQPYGSGWVLTWTPADEHGAPVVRHRVRVRGLAPQLVRGGAPFGSPPFAYLGELDPGRHVSRVLPGNDAGRGPSSTLVFRVPQPAADDSAR
jgi:hypothetical protein